MNIFVTHPDPVIAAQWLPDRHVVKMPLESAQMLAVALGKHGYDLGTLPKKNGQPYSQESHLNHPCTVWARQDEGNARWLLEHGIALCKEYTYRYGKQHACMKALIEAHWLMDEGGIMQQPMPSSPSQFALCVGQNHEGVASQLFFAYRMYLSQKHWVASNYLRKPERKPDWLN